MVKRKGTWGKWNETEGREDMGGGEKKKPS